MVLCSGTLAGEELGDSFGEDSCCSITNVEEGHPAPAGNETVHSAASLGWQVAVVAPTLGAGRSVAVDPPSDTSSVCICSFQMSLMTA